MFDCEIFAKNVKKVREIHGLSMNEMASLMQFKSKGTIGQLETLKAQPSFDFLLKMSCTFGVSIDWLIGFSELPYTEGSILNAEKNIETIIFDNNSTEIYKKFLPEFYLDVQERCEKYSLPVRANIIFLMHAFYLPFCLKIKSESLLDDVLTLYFTKPPVGKYCNDYQKQFYDLTSAKITAPFYKI